MPPVQVLLQGWFKEANAEEEQLNTRPHAQSQSPEVLLHFGAYEHYLPPDGGRTVRETYGYHC